MELSVKILGCAFLNFFKLKDGVLEVKRLATIEFKGLGEEPWRMPT